MREASIRAVLKLMGVPDKVQPSGDGWVIASCPLAPTRHKGGKDRHPSLGISVGPGPSYCKCHACGIGGKLDWLVRAVRRDGIATEFQAQEALAKLQWSKRYEPQFVDDEVPEIPPVLDPDILTRLNRWHPYFEKRNFSRREAREWRLGVMRDKHAVLMPCVLADGTVPYVQARLIAEKRFWWMPAGIKRAHVAGTHLLAGTERRIIAVEGLFDAMRVRRALRKMEWLGEYGVVALFGSKPNSDTCDHLFSVVKDELIILTDADDAGDLCADHLEEVGRKRVATISRVQLPHFTKKKDPDAAGTPVLMKALRERDNLLVTRLSALLHVPTPAVRPATKPRTHE